MESKFEDGVLTLTERNSSDVGYKITSRLSDDMFDLYVIIDWVASYVDTYRNVTAAILVGKTFD